MKYLLLIILLTYTGYSHKASINVYKIDSVNNLNVERRLNGVFLEFLLDYLNGPQSMWSQEFRDRGIDEIDNVSWDRLMHWEWYNTEEIGDINLVEGGYNENGIYQTKINKSGTGIFQEIQYVDTTSLDIYFWARTEQDNKAKVLIMDSHEEILDSFEFEIQASNWNKYSLTSSTYPGHTKLLIGFILSGTDTLYIDELSCMPSNNIGGVRKEYYDLFMHMKPGIIRYPGGWYADSPWGHWYYGIGPIDKRKSPHIERGYDQRMDLGIFEIYDFAQSFDSELHFTCNYENGTIKEAMNWLEYCHKDTTSEFGKLRSEHGKSDPMKIEWWEISNEQWDHPVEYSSDFIHFTDSLRKVDSTIKVISSGDLWKGEDFYNIVMGTIKNKTNVYGWHPTYGINPESEADDRNKYLSMVSVPYHFELFMILCDGWLKRDEYDNVKQGITEWWTDYGTHEDFLLDTHYRNSSLESALHNAYMQNVLNRHPDKIEMGERTVGIGLIKRHLNSNGERTIFGNATYHALSMQQRHVGNKLVHSFPVCETFNVTGDKIWGGSNYNYIDVTTTYDRDSLYVCVINKHPEESAETNFIINNDVKDSIRVHELWSENYLDWNSPDDPEKITERSYSFVLNNNEFEFKAHSLTILAIPFNKGDSDTIDISINEIDKPNFQVYPNPVSEKLFIEFSIEDHEIPEVFIFDINGRKGEFELLNRNKNGLLLGTNKLEQGIYLVRIKLNDRVFDHFFVKN